MTSTPTRKLTVVVHADIVDSTTLVKSNEALAHQRIQDAFRRFVSVIERYGGIAHEVRGDAVLAEFSRVSDAISGSLAFQTVNTEHNLTLTDPVQPVLRIGIAMGEVIVADGTVTGEGVVLAQRLEQLADAGTVCVQGAAYQTVPRRLPFSYRDLGEKRVKGFDEPARAYEVSLQPGCAVPEPESKTPEDTEPEVPSEPSIAVLPFTNMSGDPEQEHFSDGITEDIITALSRVEGLLVVARNSTMVYKGTAVDLKQVGREQGVRYVLEGSVRRAGDRIRVTAQLIDAESGHHVWAERYDRDLVDVFAVQDEITHEITVEMHVHLREGDQARMWAGGTRDVRAWEMITRATELKDKEIFEDNLQGRLLAEEALNIDPTYARAWVVLGLLHWNDAFWEWADSRQESLALADSAARKALQLEPDYPDALILLAHVFRLRAEHEQAVEMAEKAVTLSPNHSENTAMLAILLTCAGEPEKAVAKFERAIRLCPIYPAWYLVLLGSCYYTLGELDAAVGTLNRAIEMEPDSAFARVWLACTLIETGAEEKAKKVAAEVIRIDPGFTATDFQGAEFKDPKIGERVVANLLRAGIPA